MIAVIDTSALLRMFIPDGPLPRGLEEFFHGVENGINTALAPELLLAEAGNVLEKKRSNGLLIGGECQELLLDILDMPVRYVQHKDLMHLSLELAAKHGLTVYDCLFLALALKKSAILFSADKKILNTASALSIATGE